MYHIMKVNSRFAVINNQSNAIQSTWNTWSDASNAAKDLNNAAFKASLMKVSVQ